MRSQKEVEDKYNELVEKEMSGGLLVWERAFKETLSWVMGEEEWEE